MIFKQKPPIESPLRININDAYRMDETICINERLQQATLPPEQLQKIDNRAHDLVTAVRKERVSKSGLDAFLYEYDLAGEEGIALMCLAEALLRVPDQDTVHHLIRDKVTPADWKSHLGKSDSLFVNAATWGLMLTGKILTRRDGKNANLATALQQFLERSSKPVVINAVKQAMKILGQQFVMGKTLPEALQRAIKNEEQGYRHSFDMLGEAARTEADAQRYFESYHNAIALLAKEAKGKDIFSAPGISVKLSALHPRYEFSQREIILPELTERIRKLVLQARDANIGLTIDAEEADRLDLSLDIFEALLSDKSLGDWHGLGLAVQAYQKRAYPVITWLIQLARQHKKRINVRLAKGAYWDYEIKDSQVKGLSGYPVFTRKAATDVSYIACAKQMIAAPDMIYSQFATHNAHTVATILELMGNNRDFEFQALHGMGHALYDNLIGKDKIQCRIYAPVGTHEDLLAYLVRRLLENGANTSFVNRIIDENTPIAELIADPIKKLQQLQHKPHSKIPLPNNIFAERKNSQGLDFSDQVVQQQLDLALEKAMQKQWQAHPFIGKNNYSGVKKSVTNPSNKRKMVGEVIEAQLEEVNIALTRAEKIAWQWDQTPIEQRAAILERSADLFEMNMADLMALAISEAGKNLFDAINEVREAVDACRYYAAQAKKELITQTLPGPTGEVDQLQMHGRGVTVCISPWNFPLAIFTGQISAALVAGNPVIAKPAEQTPLIAARAIELFYEAGIPDDVLQLLPGSGEIIGAALVADTRTKTIVFTGGTATARIINQTLAKREGAITTLIAETGGQNAMFVDSTALPEQVVADVVSSAFNSAGQRCSALRVLLLQEDIADKVITMLQGAMQELKLGDSALLQTDIGPVIDDEACQNLNKHLTYLKQNAKLIYQVKLDSSCDAGTFFAPCAFELPNLAMLKQEVFGPILHVVRYKANELDKMIAAVNNTDYGLTLGIHTRINEKVNYIQQRVRAGNTYVNRNIIGAVIGVQPFGGESLSGTGPKTGGPHYLPRFCVERTLSINTTAAGGNASLMMLEE